MKAFASILVLYFLLWVAACWAVYHFIGPMWVLAPAFGGLGLYFYINRDRPSGPPPTALLLLVLLSAVVSSCSRPAPPTRAVVFASPTMVTDTSGWTGPKTTARPVDHR